MLLKILSFLHSHSDHIMASAPTLNKVLYLSTIPYNQLPKTLVTERGGDKPEAIWMNDHIEQTNLQWKNKWRIVSS